MSIQSFIGGLGWSLIHSIWQAAIIFIALHLSLKVFRQAPSKVKYILAYGALTGIFLCFLFTFYRLNIYQRQILLPPAVASGNALSEGVVQTINPETPSSVLPLWQGSMRVNYLVLLYAAGLLFFIIKIVRDLFVMKHIRSRRIAPFDKVWEHYVDKLRLSWNISKRVKLFLSEYLDVPVVIGYLKPVIYLPVSAVTNLTPAQIEAILLHELAHIKRYDFVANIFQTFIETVLFFNPFVWWISRVIRRERENCCDDLVLSATQPALYAETLLALAENQLYKGNFVLAAAGERRQLFYRIKRIMEMRTKKLNILQRLLVLFMLAAGIISVSWLTPGKKDNNRLKNPGSALQKNEHSSGTNSQTDTVVIASVPPAPPLPGPEQDSASPLMPEAPVAVPPVPGLPPALVATKDTFPGRFPDDSGIRNVQHQMQQYFNSEAWKKYQQDLQSYGRQIQQYFQSKEGRDYRLSLQRLSRQMSIMARHFDSSMGGEATGKALRAEANKMRAMFGNSNAEWKKGLDSFTRQLAKDRFSMDTFVNKSRMNFSFDKAKMDSVIVNARKNLAMEEKTDFPGMFLSRDIHSSDPNQIVSMMEDDGLIKNKNNFSVRLNENGLFINGKKQSRNSFEKYRNMVGDHTKIEIIKKGDKFKSSVSSYNKGSKAAPEGR